MKLDKFIPTTFLLVLSILLTYNPLIAGIIFGAAIIAIKASVGCRYGSVSKKIIYSTAISYFLISILLSLTLKNIVNSIHSLISYTILFHLTIAFLLIFLGFITVRKAFCGVDISNKTFVAIVIPCPACFAALLISCYFASLIFNLNEILIGAIVGAVISSGILAFSVGRRPNPEKLGKVMLILGVYYIFSILLIPAIIEGLKFDCQIQDYFDPYFLIVLVPLAFGLVRGAFRYG